MVLWRDGMNPQSVAGLASTRTYPLNSSFRPTYNMSTNLIARYGAKRSRSILETSFAQFQADRSVAGIARRVRSQEKTLTAYREAMDCHLGTSGSTPRCAASSPPRRSPRAGPAPHGSATTPPWPCRTCCRAT